MSVNNATKILKRYYHLTKWHHGHKTSEGIPLHIKFVINSFNSISNYWCIDWIPLYSTTSGLSTILRESLNVWLPNLVPKFVFALKCISMVGYNNSKYPSAGNFWTWYRLPLRYRISKKDLEHTTICCSHGDVARFTLFSEGNMDFNTNQYDLELIKLY